MRPATSTYLGIVARVLGYGRYRANVNLPPDVWLPPDLAGVGTTNTPRSRVRSHGCLWKPESPLKHSHKKAVPAPSTTGDPGRVRTWRPPFLNGRAGRESRIWSDNPTDAVQENGGSGDEGKAAGYSPGRRLCYERNPWHWGASHRRTPLSRTPKLSEQQN